MAKMRWLSPGLIWNRPARRRGRCASNAGLRPEGTIPLGKRRSRITHKRQYLQPPNRTGWCWSHLHGTRLVPSPVEPLESDLNSQTSVGQAIETNYVAVRINADYYPNTRKQYNVKTLPTTIVLAPTEKGDVLDVIPQRLPLDQYLSRLNRVADDTRRRTRPGLWHAD